MVDLELTSRGRERAIGANRLDEVQIVERKRGSSCDGREVEELDIVIGKPVPTFPEALSCPDSEVRLVWMLGRRANFGIKRDTRIIELLV
jgi:hypothetical protein